MAHNNNSRHPSIMTRFTPSLFTAALAATGFISLANAQQAPDAGQTLQDQQRQTPQLPRTGPAVDVQTPATLAATPGGAEVTLKAVRINGATVFTKAELLAVLGEVTEKSYDLAGLKALANRVTAHYQAQGYPLARAMVPQQTMAGGELRIEVIEGRYGNVQALGDAAVTDAATGFLAPLQPGQVIEGPLLERTTLILNDQPGVTTSPVIRPGQAPGTGDLDVRVDRTRGVSGSVGLDNHGNRYTGQHRLQGNVQWDSPFTFGDQILARAMYTDESLWLGSLAYSLPLGSSGLRGNVGYAHTAYELGKDFASLGASGTAKVASIGASYPVIRSQRANLTLAATFQHKKLNDKQTLAATDNEKSSDSLPVALNFDRRDAVGGGGVTYGSFSVTPGRLKLDSVLADADAAGGLNTRGSFVKWNLDVARVQATAVQGFTLFGRLSGQWANSNLDSSEGFSLGGANGVRAYPSGEGNGDEGVLAQLEARYAMGNLAPYAFYDSGSVHVNAKPVAGATDNKRSVSGAGIGVRYQAGPWSIDTVVAWRTDGGPAVSDTTNRNPRVWASAAYRF